MHTTNRFPALSLGFPTVGLVCPCWGGLTDRQTDRSKGCSSVPARGGSSSGEWQCHRSLWCHESLQCHRSPCCPPSLHCCTHHLFLHSKETFWNKLPTLASPPFLWEGGEAIGAEDINAGGGMVFKCNELLKEMMSLNPEAFPVV